MRRETIKVCIPFLACTQLSQKMGPKQQCRNSKLLRVIMLDRATTVICNIYVNIINL